MLSKIEWLHLKHNLVIFLFGLEEVDETLECIRLANILGGKGVFGASPNEHHYLKNQVIFVVIYTRSDDPEEIATKYCQWSQWSSNRNKEETRKQQVLVSSLSPPTDRWHHGGGTLSLTKLEIELI